jgi:hypothetical protein
VWRGVVQGGYFLAAATVAVSFVIVVAAASVAAATATPLQQLHHVADWQVRVVEQLHLLGVGVFEEAATEGEKWREEADVGDHRGGCDGERENLSARLLQTHHYHGGVLLHKYRGEHHLYNLLEVWWQGSCLWNDDELFAAVVVTVVVLVTTSVVVVVVVVSTMEY